MYLFIAMHNMYRIKGVWAVIQTSNCILEMETMFCSVFFQVRALALCTTVRLNSSIRSCTALSLAVYQGDLTIVQILLHKGAEV